MRLRYRQSPFWTYTHTCSSIVGLEPRLDRGHDEALGFCEPGNHSRVESLTVHSLSQLVPLPLIKSLIHFEGSLG